MGNPWDRPPFPKRGNKSIRVLQQAMGFSLSAWEQIEIALAHLYAAMTTGDRFNSSANHAYGEPANFAQRFASLQQIAEQHFMKYPSQDIEGEFCRLGKLITGYSGRRNDIAHSQALYIHWAIDHPPHRTILGMTENDRQWCLTPPHFRANKFTGRNRPAYALTSREVREFGLVFWDIAHAVSNLSIWVIQHAIPPLHGIRPRPSALPYKVRDPRIPRGLRPQPRPPRA